MKIVDSNIKKDSSKIPIRLDSPPKRIETLEEQQVISIARVKTSPTKRSRKHTVNKAYISTTSHDVPEESNDSKIKRKNSPLCMVWNAMWLKQPQANETSGLVARTDQWLSLLGKECHDIFTFHLCEA